MSCFLQRTVEVWGPLVPFVLNPIVPLQSPLGGSRRNSGCLWHSHQVLPEILRLSICSLLLFLFHFLQSKLTCWGSRETLPLPRLFKNKFPNHIVLLFHILYLCKVHVGLGYQEPPMMCPLIATLSFVDMTANVVHEKRWNKRAEGLYQIKS